MGALDTAREILRISSTAGLSKDVIDLLEKKVALLTEEIASLRAEISRLQTENANLRAKPQHAKHAQFAESEGLLWKRTAAGFESRPYCPECPTHPVMTPFPPGEPLLWTCPSDHTFDYASKPPTA